MNYYEILEVSPQATGTEIRMAYKRMAMLYHPDRNAGDKSAEEKFKIINEAYQVLSDPLKKARYDNQQYGKTTAAPDTESYEYKRRKYYAYRKASEQTYVVDRNYVRVQALAFLVFLIFAGTCFGIIHTVNYFADQRELAKWRESLAQLHRAYAMFGSGDFDNAFGLVEKLQIEHPFETRITVARDSLFVELREMADDRFRAKEFEAAATYYAVLSQKQKPQRLEVTLQLSRCYYYLEKYDKAIQSLEHVRAQQPWNLELLYEVGLIYYEKLDNPQEALRYFTEGKNLFIKNMSSVYGAAFEILINPKNVPTIYFDIFVMRGKANLRLNNDKEAITDFNWAVFLRPEHGEPYRLRAEGEIRIKDFGEACEDLVMAARRGIAVTELQRLYCR